MSDAGDELAECSKLLGLREPPAELLALGLELLLRRQIARDDDAADALAVAIEEIGDREHERSVQYRIDYFARGRLPVRTDLGALVHREPGGQFRPDALGEGAFHEILTRPPQASGEGLVDVHQPAAGVRDGDQVRDRIERVFKLLTRPHDGIEQLHRLDGAGQLSPELVGAIEQIELAARFDSYAFEDDRAERAAIAAQRNGHSR